MRITKTTLIVCTTLLLAAGFLSYFVNFFVFSGLRGFSDSQEHWSHFGGYVSGIFGSAFGFISVVLLIYTYFAAAEQKDEQFVLKHIEHILSLNKRMVTVYNLKHTPPWHSDDGMALITNYTKETRGGTFVKAHDPKRIWDMLIEKQHLQILYEFEQFLAALNYLVYWDSERAEISPKHDPSGFRSRYRTLISSYLPPNLFSLIYNLSVLEIADKKFGEIPVNYSNRFKDLVEFVRRVGPQNQAPEHGA